MLPHLLIACIAAFSGVAPDPRQAPDVWDWGSGRLERLERALFPVEGARGGAKALSPFGAEALTGYFEVLLLDRLPPGEGGPGRALDGPARAILLQAVEDTGRESVVGFVGQLLAEPRDEARRTVALEFLGRVVTWKDLPLAFGLASGGESAYSGAPAKLTELIDRLLAADPARCLLLEPQILSSDAPCQESALLAIAAHPCRQVGGLLARLLGHDALLDPALLSRLGEFWRSHPVWIEATDLEPVRRMASERSGACQREALMALGQARDESAIPLLLAAVEGPDQALAACAHRAFEALSGLRLRSQRGLWRRHVERGRHWELERGPAARSALASGDAGEVARALLEISEQRLARDRWSEAVCQVLERGDLQLSSLAIAALSALGSPRSIPSLLALVEDSSLEQRLRDLAHGALCQITGLGLPQDPEALRLELAQP